MDIKKNILLAFLLFFNSIAFADDIEKLQSFYSSESFVIKGDSEESFANIYIPKGALIYPNCSSTGYLYAPILSSNKTFFTYEQKIDFICIKYKGFNFIWGVKTDK